MLMHVPTLQGAMNAAVDAYLAIRASDSPDKSKLESAWTSAARLAGQGPRAAQVLNECRSRLLAIGRAEAAASLHTNAGDKRGAVRAHACCYCCPCM